MAATDWEVAIDVRGIWTVFGPMAKRAMDAILRESLSKSEVRDRFNCVVGVRDASFAVGRGEVFCIMGLSGSGKSRLIRHLNRQIEPTHGTVYIDGRNVSAMNGRELRANRIGKVFQNMALMPHRTVRENVAFSLEVRGRPDEERAQGRGPLQPGTGVLPSGKAAPWAPRSA